MLRAVPFVVLAVAGAGALGALARWGVDEWLERHSGLFPWGIFVVNVTGAFLVGFFATWMEPRFEDVTWLRTGVLVGFLGAYTTFSTFSLDTYRLLDAGHMGTALANALGTLAAGLVAVWAGIRLAQAM
jgi:CrcB protein